MGQRALAAGMTATWRAAPPLDEELARRLRRRAIFECDKWDPQAEDNTTLSDAAIILTPAAWHEITQLASALARETLAAEAELLQRPDLLATLALPRTVRRPIERAVKHGTSPGTARLIRFDFHLTTDGWQVSEANTDVPGGLNEASGWTALVAQQHADAVPAGDVTALYARALLDGLGPGAHVALLHATAYSDDHQVMAWLARNLEARGASASLASPAHVVWQDGLATLSGPWHGRPIDRIARFFPAEWLPELPARARWQHFFHGARTPASNPGSALLVQSKRFPLVWPRLDTPLSTWRALLPETRDPRELRKSLDDDWVLKPALGRVGEGVIVPGVTDQVERRKAARDARRWPQDWIAQRRFQPLPLVVCEQPVYPCLGVYTVDTDVAGIYGRIGRTPLIDWRAQDIAVLVERETVQARSRAG
jgi:glutathionylspermidine synthase